MPGRLDLLSSVALAGKYRNQDPFKSLYHNQPSQDVYRFHESGKSRWLTLWATTKHLK